MTNGSGATIVTTRRVAAPNLGDARASAIGLGLTHPLATKAKAAGVDQSGGDGLANTFICIAVMVACVLAYIVLAHSFMA